MTEVDLEEFGGLVQRMGSLEVSDLCASRGPRGCLLRSFTLTATTFVPAAGNEMSLFATSGSGTTYVYRHDQCAIAQVNGAWPRVVVRRRSAGGRLEDVVRGPSGSIEWEEFNRRFDVEAPTERLAVRLLSADLCAFIAGIGAEVEYHFDGKWLLVRAPVAVVLDRPLIEVLRGVCERLPTVLYDLYPSPWADRFGKPLLALDDLEERRQLREELEAAGLLERHVDDALALDAARSEIDADLEVSDAMRRVLERLEHPSDSPD